MSRFFKWKHVYWRDLVPPKCLTDDMLYYLFSIILTFNENIFRMYWIYTSCKAIYVIFTELRKAVRSSLYRKDTGRHEHEYGEETYNEADDTYSKTCETCGYTMTYEKLWNALP